MKSLQFRTAIVVFVFCAFALVAFGQDDPDPNSPAPRLITETDATRVLAVDADSFIGVIPRTGAPAFKAGANIVVFLRGIDLPDTEKYNAFRAYLGQTSGKLFELTTTRVVRTRRGDIELFLTIQDRDGFRGQPAALGDSLFFVTWRGLTSNYLKLGIGYRGGDIKLPAAARAASSSPSAPDYVGYRWAGDRIRFLEQATFGPKPADDERIRRIGIRTWIAEQFAEPYPSLPYPEIAAYPTNVPSNCSATTFPTCYRDHYSMVPLQTWFFREAAYGSDQLRLRTAWALSQVLVTSGVVTQQSSHAIAYQKLLMNDAFGNYLDLLRDVTLSPTMGNYLDTARSTKANPNENYPREVMQLFSIGLFMLDPDGTQKLDDNGQPIPSYSQQDINELKKVFTGWTFDQTGPHASPGIINYLDPMTVNPANHDTSAKQLLNYPGATVTAIPACADCTTNEQTAAYARASLDTALDNIFHHPNVGPFIGKLLIQHLVTSDPSPAYVERVASAFNDNGAGVRGDMKAVIRAILLDPEARGDAKTAPRYGKLREPVQLISNLMRIFPAVSFDGSTVSDGALSGPATQMGENPFNSPTVFNYFPPDHIVAGTTLLGPEFALLNTGLAVKRTNFLHIFIFEGLTPNAYDSLRGTSLDLSEYAQYASEDATGQRLLDVLNNRMMHGTLSDAMRAAILPAIQAVPASDPLSRAKTAVYLIAASSPYQIQK